MYKFRQKVEVQGWDMNSNETWEAATIARTREPKPGDDWHLVEFATGGRLFIHETRLRAA